MTLYPSTYTIQCNRYEIVLAKIKHVLYIHTKTGRCYSTPWSRLKLWALSPIAWACAVTWPISNYHWRCATPLRLRLCLSGWLQDANWRFQCWQDSHATTKGQVLWCAAVGQPTHRHIHNKTPYVRISMSNSLRKHYQIITNPDWFAVAVRSAVKSFLTTWCDQNLSKSALNVLTVLALTTELGRLFQVLTRRRSESAYICQVHDNVITYTSSCLHTHLPGNVCAQ